MHSHAGARRAMVIGRCSRVTQQKTLFQGQVITRKTPLLSYSRGIPSRVPQTRLDAEASRGCSLGFISAAPLSPTTASSPAPRPSIRKYRVTSPRSLMYSLLRRGSS
jgi:predicted dienelactone hydrolase